MLPVAAIALSLAACGDDDIDNAASRNLSVIQITPSADYIKLDETKPDEVALTLEWSPAHNYGNEYITTYEYEMQLDGSAADKLHEYEDDAVFRRSYTNKELQDMLVDKFGQTTSTLGTMIFTVTASFNGPRLVVPDIATANVKIKTYGAKQFLADQMWMSGTAVGEEKIEMERSDKDADVFMATAKLMPGTINFPLVNFDENNAIGPVEPDTEVAEGDMEAAVADETEANYWVIPEEDTYKITVNLRTQTVRIVSATSLVSVDKLFMAGSAVGSENIEMTTCLEQEGLYAWKGELKAGTLYMPFELEGNADMALVSNGSQDITDGISMIFGQVATSAAGNKAWRISEAGTYRVVADIENKSVTIYSAATDLKNTSVSYNNTVDKINPYTQEVTELWMWGGFNAAAHDSDLKAGFQAKYKLTQSLANPNVFVYMGDVLPRETVKDDNNKKGDNVGKAIQGYVKFLVSSIENNVYAYGSTADAKRNDHSGYVSPALGETSTVVGGQGDNRYAFFIIPEGCNYVCVDIAKKTVVFDKK